MFPLSPTAWIASGIAVISTFAVVALFSYQQGRASRQPEINAMNQLITRSIERAKAQTDAAQNEVGRLSLELAKQQAIIASDYGDTTAQIEVVTRPDRACLSPGAARVLRDAIARANSRLAESISAAQHPQGEPATADAGIDERTIGRWTAAIVSQYRQTSARHSALAAIVERLPCVEVDESR